INSAVGKQFYIVCAVGKIYLVGSLRADALIKNCVGGSVCVQPGDVEAQSSADALEAAADENFAVGLDDNRRNIKYAVASQNRIKSSVQTAVRIESDEAGVRRAADSRKITADQNFAVRLDSDAANIFG